MLKRKEVLLLGNLFLFWILLTTVLLFRFFGEIKSEKMLAQSNIRNSALMSQLELERLSNEKFNLKKNINDVISSAAAEMQSFPRWGSEGIDMELLVEFLDGVTAIIENDKRNLRDQMPNSEAVKRYATTIRSRKLRWVFPEILYVVDSDNVWKSFASKKSGYIRAQTTEENIFFAWRLLLSNTNNEMWPRLKQVLRRQNDSQRHNGSAASPGFPFLGWYGDMRACNQGNWVLRPNISIPLFTVCAKVNCSYAFPMPSYKTIIDSQPTSNDWDAIMSNYSFIYGSWQNKIPKVVWRGALTRDFQNFSKALELDLESSRPNIRIIPFLTLVLYIFRHGTIN